MIPNIIDSPSSKLIYLYLLESDKAKSPEEISDELNMSMLAVLPILKIMRNSNQIKRKGGDTELYCIPDRKEE